MSVTYPFWAVSALEFEFDTRYIVRYVARFVESGYLFGEVVWADSSYDFSIRVKENPAPAATPPDTSVPPTIAEILRLFFREQERVVLYSCETDDGRGAARASKFDGWFRQFNEESFIKADRTLFDPRLNLTYQNSVLLRADNQYRAEILAAFEALFGGLEAQK